MSSIQQSTDNRLNLGNQTLLGVYFPNQHATGLYTGKKYSLCPNF